jgi:hypothetical protein
MPGQPNKSSIGAMLAWNHNCLLSSTFINLFKYLRWT